MAAFACFLATARIDDPDQFLVNIHDVLGDDYPYFVAIGNHDLERFFGSKYDVPNIPTIRGAPNNAINAMSSTSPDLINRS